MLILLDEAAYFCIRIDKEKKILSGFNNCYYVINHQNNLQVFLEEAIH